MRSATTVSGMLLVAAMAISSHADAVMLPNYNQEAGKVHVRKCDSDMTNITMYRTPSYYVTEAVTNSGDSFIMFYSYEGAAHFLMKSAGSLIPAELSREQWYDKIAEAGPNYFSHVRGTAKSDCYIAERYNN